MTTDFRALCAELIENLEIHCEIDVYSLKLINRARAALAAEPVPPADGEVAGLVAWLHGQDGGIDRRATYSRIADLLSRLAPQPVPEGPSDKELWRIGDPEFQSNTWPTDAVRLHSFPTRRSSDRKSVV